MTDPLIQEGPCKLGGVKPPPTTPKPDVRPVGTSPIRRPAGLDLEPVFGDQRKTRWRVTMDVEFTAVVHGDPHEALWLEPYDSLNHVLEVLRNGCTPRPAEQDILRSSGLIEVRSIVCIQEPLGM